MIKLTTKGELLVGKFLWVLSPLLLVNSFKNRNEDIFYIKLQNHQIFTDHVLELWESKKSKNFNDFAH